MWASSQGNDANKVLLATLLISICLISARAKDKIESTSQSIVSRLNPALRKALLKALSTIEIDESNEQESSTELGAAQTTTSSPREEELLEESTAADLQALNLYNSYITDGVNFTQKSKDENEIIHTFIVKAPKTTVAPTEQTNDQVIIQFGVPDPVKDSDVHIETVQIARSVKTNEIDDADETSAEDFKVTTYKPTTTTFGTTTNAEVPTTTATPAPTHNEDGENIERVEKNDVKIYQAPLVAAFTVQQDAQGLPKNVIPLLSSLNAAPSIAQPVQQFTITSTQATTASPFTIAKTHPTFAPIPSTTPLAFQLPSENSAPSFSLSKSLELPSTKEAAFTTFALERKRKELEEQIVLLQQQQRQQEESFRQQQLFQEQQALNRQQQLLLQQRYRFEEENRARLQRYEQEQQILRQQQQQQPQQQFFARFPSLNQLPPPPPPQHQQQSNSVQVIPSLSFTTSPVPISTQQLLPVREPNDFRPKPVVTFQPSQPLPLFHPQTASLLATGPQLPQRPAQQFLSPPTFQTPLTSLNNIDPVAVSDQTQGRNRVFRQESDTANFGLNSVNTNFPPIYPVFNVDSQLQNLLLQSGISNGRSNEDINIISKVLALNHGIQTGSNNFYQNQRGRFVRNAKSPEAH